MVTYTITNLDSRGQLSRMRFHHDESLSLADFFLSVFPWVFDAGKVKRLTCKSKLVARSATYQGV